MLKSIKGILLYIIMLKQLYDWLNKKNKIMVTCEWCKNNFYIDQNIGRNIENYCSFQCGQNKLAQIRSS